MSGYIARPFIDEVLARTDIVDLINTYVPLRKSGKNYMACCPFHNEKTPSFSVNQAKQFYHCFGCDASGNAISFLMDYLHLAFIDAVQELADRVDLPVVYEQGQSQENDNNSVVYLQLMQMAQAYQQQLNQAPAQHLVRRYLQQRGLQAATVTQFGLGYAPDAWHFVSQTLKQSPAQLNPTGLISENKNRFYDRFRHRLMFPIHDKRGRIVGFGGRVLDDGKPKYLNSPETAVFHKSAELYGLYQVRQQRPSVTQIMVVEGYMDVLALHQAGFVNAVATLGTATHNEHVQQIFRLVNDVLFCFDGDEAGKKAAWRALEICLPFLTGARQVKFAFLPHGEDPDSVVQQHGTIALQKQLDAALPLSQFLFEHWLRQTNVHSLEGQAQLLALAKPLLQQIPAGAYLTLLQKRLAELTQLNLPKVAQLTQSAPIQAQTPKQAQVNHSVQPSLVRTAIVLLLQQPKLAQSVASLADFARLERKGIDLLVKLLEFAQKNPTLTTGSILEHWRNTPYEKPLAILARQTVLENTDIKAEFLGAINGLTTAYQKQRIAYLSSQHLMNLTAEDKEELRQPRR
jgi:DNA primase